MTVSMFGKSTHVCPVCHMYVTVQTLEKNPECSVCEVPLVPLDVPPTSDAALDSLLLDHDKFTHGG